MIRKASERQKEKNTYNIPPQVDNFLKLFATWTVENQTHDEPEGDPSEQDPE